MLISLENYKTNRSPDDGFFPAIVRVDESYNKEREEEFHEAFLGKGNFAGTVIFKFSFMKEEFSIPVELTRLNTSTERIVSTWEEVL